MRKAISMWIFSRVVMLVFLFLTFFTVLSFMRVMNERVASDAGKVMTMQIHDSLQSVLSSRVLASQLVVPIPEKLPEPGILKPGEQAGLSRSYTLTVAAVDGPSPGTTTVVSVALSWGVGGTPAYAAASSLVTSSDFTLNARSPVGYSASIDSEQNRFIVINRQYISGVGGGSNIVCIFGCSMLSPVPNCTIEGRNFGLDGDTDVGETGCKVL